MENSVETASTTFGVSAGTMAIIILVVIGGLYIAYTYYTGYLPQPSYKTGFEDKPAEVKKDDKPTEGFFGGVARGAGSPDCLRSSAEGSELVAMFQGVGRDNDYNAENARELKQIMSKLLCFKKDLISPSHIVEATRYQQFVTMHDIEPIAETTGRCFAKTISPRDLEIAFDKWTTRGEKLIRMLCADNHMSSAESDKAMKLFQYVIRDVKDIARGACLEGEPMIAGKPGPRDAHPYESPDYENVGEYKGYY
jgi:hypothetical protein